MLTKKLSPKELAGLFVEYRDLYDKLQEAEARISEQVLLQGETQKIAGVTATYYKPSEKVDYEAAAGAVYVEDLDKVIVSHSTMKRITSWKEVCEEIGVDVKPFSEPIPARVVVKVK